MIIVIMITGYYPWKQVGATWTPSGFSWSVSYEEAKMMIDDDDDDGGGSGNDDYDGVPLMELMRTMTAYTLCTD